MEKTKPENKKAMARAMGVSRSLIYYHHKQPVKDWQIKQQIEKVLREFPSYGHKRIARLLARNKKSVLRVMHVFDIKPYRRRGKKWRKPKKKELEPYPNKLIQIPFPSAPSSVWMADFTHVGWKRLTIYIATVMDLFSRKIVGLAVRTNHSKDLVISAFCSAILNHPIPGMHHSDQGSEYLSKDYIDLLLNLGVEISMSNAGCPWENGYQESFYSQFKVDLGDPNRFEGLGELVCEIYRTVWIYNNRRIHTALKMPPIVFENNFRHQFLIAETVSKEMGT